LKNLPAVNHTSRDWEYFYKGEIIMTESALDFKTEQHPWWLHLMSGIFNLIIGFLLLTVPVKTVFVLVVALGLYWIVSGMFVLVGMFVDHSAWGWKLFVGLISILAGTYILRYPLISAVTIPQIIILLMGIQGLISGIVMLVMAFKGGGLGSGILGALSVIFGGVLIANYSAPGMVITLVWVVAVFALVGGIGQIVQAFMQRA
jgi:uncharacterized membrane protein HdeD (DUF308 family)